MTDPKEIFNQASLTEDATRLSSETCELGARAQQAAAEMRGLIERTRASNKALKSLNRALDEAFDDDSPSPAVQVHPQPLVHVRHSPHQRSRTVLHLPRIIEADAPTC